MTKEEFMELSLKKWEEIKKLRKTDSFYEYEKGFDELWTNFGRKTLEGSIGEVGIDRRKKKVRKPFRRNRDNEIK